jgi:hypothetical protein
MNVLAAALVSYALLSPTGGQVQSTPKMEVVRPSARRPATVTPAKPVESGPCQIGVISLAGDLFSVEKYGALKFLDTYAHTSVAAWGLDELVVSRVRAAAPGSSVRGIPYTRQELTEARRQRSFFRDYDGNLLRFVQYLASRTRCERYIAVLRRGGTQREFGIGISYHLDARVFLFAMMSARVYDGRTFEIIGDAPAREDDYSALQRALHDELGGPYRILDAAMFPAKPADAVKNLVLRDGVRAMLTKSLDKTLPALLQGPSPSR